MAGRGGLLPAADDEDGDEDEEEGDAANDRHQQHGGARSVAYDGRRH